MREFHSMGENILPALKVAQKMAVPITVEKLHLSNSILIINGCISKHSGFEEDKHNEVHPCA